MIARILPGLILFASLLNTQPVPQSPEWRPPAAEAPLRPQAACAALRAWTGYDFTVIAAVLQPAAAGLPEFCRVTGQVQPEVRFEVALPSVWNKRLLMAGNGGYAGEDIDAPGRAGARNAALRMGFTFAQTNTGHDARQEPLGSFALNSQKLFDYAFRAVHVTAETAKRLAEAYYGARPSRSYFQGCSTGGRQALIAAQRFPGDFDGIVAGAPVLDFSGTMMQYTSWARALEAGPIPPSKLKLLAERIYAGCDARDGLQDGLIDDPRRCGFQPSRQLPRCTGSDGPDCFTAAQIQTLETIYSDLRINGQRRYPGWPVSAEAAGANGRSGWDGWIVREGEPTIAFRFAETFFRYLAFPQKDPNLQLHSVDVEREAPRLEWISRVLDATDTDLSGFRDRGGKLLMWFGWADPALNAARAVEYYEAVRQKMGPQTGDFFRLFMLPGVFHCGGGVGCDAFPRLAALIDWVEQGKAPGRLIAARIENGRVVRTRPLCPYPETARYQGSGSIDDAANFRCSAESHPGPAF